MVVSPFCSNARDGARLPAVKVLVHALRLILAFCVVLPAAPTATESMGGEYALGWSVVGPFCQGLPPCESRPEERTVDTRPNGRLDGPNGSTSSGSDASIRDVAALAPTGPEPLGASLEPFDDAVRGAVLAARAFLRVNGSANANGARA